MICPCCKGAGYHKDKDCLYGPTGFYDDVWDCNVCADTGSVDEDLEFEV